MASAGRYDDYYLGKNISWDVDAFDLAIDFDPTVSIVWLGKVLETSVFRDSEGKTSIEYLCEQYKFYTPGPSALVEPFVIHPDPKGYFVIVISVALPVEIAKQKILGENSTEKWALVSGHGDFIRQFNGKKAVYLMPKSFHGEIGDTFVVNYVKESEANNTN